MSPKCQAICERLRAARKPGPGMIVLHPVSRFALAYARTRRRKLEAERPYWSALVTMHHGDTVRIGRNMGCDVRAAERALWDLGLWPAVVRERGGAR